MPRTRAQPYEREAKEWSQAFGGQKRLWLVAVGCNGLLLLVLLGLPYLRGRSRARAAWSAHDRFAACIFPGAKPRSVGDSGQVKDSETSAFASLALHGGTARLAQCNAALAAVAPARDIFVLPSLKRAEEVLREAVRVVAQELGAMPARPGPGARLSIGPLRAIEQLRFVLAEYSREADLEEPPLPAPLSSAPTPPAQTAVPTRIPLYVGADAVVTIWGTDSEVHAAGLDRTGLSYIALADHVLTRARLVRPKLLRDLVVTELGPLLVWGMSRARCRDTSCAGKTTGIARAPMPLTHIPQPRWLAAHLEGRADRSLLSQAGRLYLLADGGAVHAEMRTFLRPERDDESTPDAELPPLSSVGQWEVASEHGALALLQQGTPAALSTVHAGDSTRLILTSARGTTELASLPGLGAAFSFVCSGPEQTGFVAGVSKQLVLGTLRASTAKRVWPPLPLPLGEPLHDSDRTRDRVQLQCLPDGLLALVVDDQQKLHSIFCATSADACVLNTIADGVASFAVAATPSGQTVAYAGPESTPQVRVRNLDRHGQTSGDERIPAVCWAPRGGLCGQPTLALLGSRLVLAAREGTDLVALESADDGGAWEPLHGGEVNLPTSQFGRSAERIAAPRQ